MTVVRLLSIVCHALGLIGEGGYLTKKCDLPTEMAWAHIHNNKNCTT